MKNIKPFFLTALSLLTLSIGSVFADGKTELLHTLTDPTHRSKLIYSLTHPEPGYTIRRLNIDLLCDLAKALCTERGQSNFETMPCTQTLLKFQSLRAVPTLKGICIDESDAFNIIGMAERELKG